MWVARLVRLDDVFRKRMTAHECLLHPWLTGDHSDRTTALNSSNYVKMRDKIRQKYDDWDSFAVPIGRISEYSALRKLMVEKYKIYESSFGTPSPIGFLGPAK